ncbi:MAG: DJ-1/PfpI family protein [Succinivibrio sp.]
MDISAVVFDGFTALDLIGPMEALSRLPGARARYASLQGRSASSGKGLEVKAAPLEQIPSGGIIVIPGGFGTRALVSDQAFLSALRQAALRQRFILTVCTGSALAAAAGLLDGKSATGNKKSFDWTASMGPGARWVREARWTRDGNTYTAGGVAAGIDMALGFIKDQFGLPKALEIASSMEYRWKDCPQDGLSGF